MVNRQQIGQFHCGTKPLEVARLLATRFSPHAKSCSLGLCIFVWNGPTVIDLHIQHRVKL